MVILVDVDDDVRVWVGFLRVELDESESDSGLEPELEPVPAEETFEATEDTLERST